MQNSNYVISAVNEHISSLIPDLANLNYKKTFKLETFQVRIVSKLLEAGKAFQNAMQCQKGPKSFANERRLYAHMSCETIRTYSMIVTDVENGSKEQIT